MLVSEFLPKWLSAHAPSVRPSTVLAHRTRLTKHLIPRIGTIELADLDTFAVQALYGDLLAVGLSPRTVRGIHQTLTAAMRMGVKWRLIAGNPCEDAVLPLCERYEAETLRADQVRTLFESAKRTRLLAAWVVFVGCGLRRGELLSLRWSDVQLDAGVLCVSRTWTKTVDGVWTIGPVKTKKGRRHIALSSTVLDALRAHLTRQKRERLRLGTEYTNADLVFCRRDGKPLNPDSLDHRFRLLVTKAGLPPVRLHDLRHTFATLLLGEGANVKAVSEMLGHSDVGVTLNTYTHVDLDQQRRIMEHLSDLIAG